MSPDPKPPKNAAEARFRFFRGGLEEAGLRVVVYQDRGPIHETRIEVTRDGGYLYDESLRNVEAWEAWGRGYLLGICNPIRSTRRRT